MRGTLLIYPRAKKKTENGAHPSRRVRGFTDGRHQGWGTASSGIDPRIARASASVRSAIVEHGNIGAWRSSSATAPVKAITSTSDTEVV
jgi:hypothetical protein